MTAATHDPRWVVPSLTPDEGQDPLGLQSMTQDRLMPRLLPGVLELSQVARYFSFHAFLLDEYRRRRLPANLNDLSRFIKECEWDLGLAVQRCPRRCDMSPVGARRLGAVDASAAVLPRGESVDSSLGGYGLYYRSPMTALGLVARAGSLLGGEPTPLDVLRSDSPRAAALVAEYRAAVDDTTYAQKYLATDEPIPVEVITEYAAQACLCRLVDHPDERTAVHEALFGADPADEERPDPELMPDVAVDRSTYRRAASAATGTLSPAHELVAGQWAAVMAKDVWQDALCSLWSSFCRAGVAAGRQIWGGLGQAELDHLVDGLLDESPRLDGRMPIQALVDHIASGSASLPCDGAEPLTVADVALEDLRIATAQTNTATSGLLVILELARRARTRSDEGWTTVLNEDAAWQPSVREAVGWLQDQIQRDETVRTVLRQMLDRFVVRPHEQIAYSKLAGSRFTFRFRWDDGRMQFFDNGTGRFPLAGIRHDPLRRITYDLGLWSDRDAPRLTAAGRDFVSQVLS